MKNTNRYIYIRQGRIQSQTLGGLIVFFHVKSFLTLLFAIGSIAAWEGHDPPLPESAHEQIRHLNEMRSIAHKLADTCPTHPTRSICCAHKSMNFIASEQ